MKMANIVETATTAGSFKTLVKAVKAAGLVETFSGSGPFTVFAPTDEAFDRLPSGTIQALLNDIPRLTAVLTYHVVPGKLMASDVVKQRTLKTAQGQNIALDISHGVRVNDASVIKTDVLADNGVIHVIDKVILPK